MAKKNGNTLRDIAVIFVVSAVILALIQVFLGGALAKAANKLKIEFSEQQFKLQESEALIRALPDPKKAMEDIAKKAEEFKDAEINKKQVPRLVTLLGASISQYNMSVASIRPRDDIRSSSENLPPGVNKVYIEVVLNCSYQELGEYLANLGKLQVAFIVESITIDKKAGKDIAAVVQDKLKEKDPGKPRDLVATLLLSTYMVLEI